MQSAASRLLTCSACGDAPQPCCANQTCLQKGTLCDIKDENCAVASASCGKDYSSCCAGFQCAVPFQCYRPGNVCMPEQMWFSETEFWIMNQS